jgi:hypothetical protein
MDEHIKAGIIQMQRNTQEFYSDAMYFRGCEFKEIPLYHQRIAAANSLCIRRMLGIEQ